MARQTFEVSMSIAITKHKQYSAPATDVNGTTWKDLLDKSTITKPTRIWGFKAARSGSWLGSPCVRITDGAGEKIFPYQDEYVEGVDFPAGEQVVFTAAVDVAVEDGFKFQFRSTSSGDGAGKTLELNNLDVQEVG